MWVYLYSDEWLPWDNTIAYIPMETDLLDHWPNSITVTNNNSVALASNVGSATIPVWNFWDWTVRRYLTFTNNTLMSGASTVNVWAYYNGFSISNWQFLAFAQGTNSNYKAFILNLQNNSNNWFCTSLYWTDIYSNIYPTAQNWHNVCYTYDGNKGSKMYLDWVLIKSGTFSTAPALTQYNAHIWTNPRNTSAMFNGYMSEWILENKTRTAEEIANYYNSTKSKYWIS